MLFMFGFEIVLKCFVVFVMKIVLLLKFCFFVISFMILECVMLLKSLFLVFWLKSIDFVFVLMVIMILLLVFVMMILCVGLMRFG